MREKSGSNLMMVIRLTVLLMAIAEGGRVMKELKVNCGKIESKNDDQGRGR